MISELLNRNEGQTDNPVTPKRHPKLTYVKINGKTLTELTEVN